MNQATVRTISGVGFLALAAAAAALMFGEDFGWATFALGLLALLAYHVRNLNRLLDWLGRSDPGDVPDANGVWDDAFALLHRHERLRGHELTRIRRLLIRYGQAGRALPDAVVVLDGENRIQWCNDRAQDHLGIDARADVGQLVTNLVRQPEFVEYMAAGDYSKPADVRSGRGVGAILSVQIVPYDDSQKLLLARDMTQAETLDRVRRDFVANVSHELRTPLTVLIGFLETVRELKLDPKRQRDYLDMMADQAQRMQRIIEDLLTLSSLESAPEPSPEERIVVARLLARVKVDGELLSAGRHRISLDAQGDYDLLGAETEISSAFANLVTNAVRYTPEGGEIRLRWRASPEGATFAVEDTGLGIEREHIPRLTERFYRIDRGRSRETGGTGLGLAIVKHALLRHQATLEIESEPGRGSCFTAHFPARRVVAAQPTSGVPA